MTKFDPKSILGAPKTPNFDQAIRIGWNQLHWEDCQILIPMTVHGSKSELERSRCHENRDKALIDAPLTFESHNFWFDCWIFKIHTFLEKGSQDLSKHVNIKPIQGILKVAALEGPPPWNSCRGYKKPQAPFRPGEGSFFFGRVLLSTWFFYTFFPSLKHKKHIKTSWFFSLHQKHRVLFLYLIFFSLVLHLGFGVYGCGYSFLSTTHTPNLLNLFLKFILLFCLNNMIYYSL